MGMEPGSTISGQGGPSATATPPRVVLDDHARLPWRFFGRLTAAVQAGL
jgi:hypothetical protein